MHRVNRNTTRRTLALFCVSLALCFAIVPGSVYGQQGDTPRLRLWGINNIYGGYLAFNEIYVECGDNCGNLNRFDILVDLGPAAYAFDSVSEGWLIEDAGWEHFSYEIIYDSLLHMELIADVPEIPGEPYYPNWDGELLHLWFHFPNDSTTDCALFPLKFYWLQCDDNIVETRSADTIYVSEQVYDWPGVAEGHVPFPYPSGVPSYRGTPDWCLDYIPSDAEIVRHIEFWDGGFQMHCYDSLYPGERGDINLNSIPYEIADFVLLSYYFLYGLDVFDINLEGQTQNSDVNCDGEVLTFRDLIYLWAVITGEFNPCLGPITFDTSSAVWFIHDPASNTVRVQSPGIDLAGAYMVFSDSILPTIAVPDFEVQHYYNSDSSKTHVLIPPVWPGTTIGTGPLLTIEGPGLLTEAYTTDYQDSEVPTVVIIAADIDFAVALIQHVFFDGPVPEPYEQADADCSGYIDIDDIVWVIEYIFMGGPAPGDC